MIEGPRSIIRDECELEDLALHDDKILEYTFVILDGPECILRPIKKE